MVKMFNYLNNSCINKNFKVMFAKLNSSENRVKINKIAKNQESLSIFNVDEDKSFLKFCMQISEVNFKRKNLQFSETSKNLSK